MDVTRRKALLTTLFGTGYAGLRGLATGLPAWFILAPETATAQDLQCLLTSQGSAQFLVLSASSAGDPLACNAPGAYDPGGVVVHPANPEFVKTTVTMGTKSAQGAAIWQTGLTDAVRARTAFFHHITGGLVHGDHPKVMKILGQTSNNEMYMSVYAKHLAKCLGTVQSEPVVLAPLSALELVTFSGRTLPTVSPTQLKQLLTGSATDPLVKLRTIRDRTLDSLNALAKTSATNVQAQFLDALVTSQTQVRELSVQLGTTLAAITDDTPASQALAAAALIAAKVTPVVTMHIPFGGDNHTDAALYQEWFDTTDHGAVGAGVPGIQAVVDALAALGLSDTATFATANVFGRTLNGIAKVTAQAGRDHYGDHCVTVMIGKNVAGGVYGGVAAIAGGAAFGATDIDSATGGSLTGGDIPRLQTHVSLAKTLGAVLGIPQSVMQGDFVSAATGKPVPAACVAFPG
jgi:hypothetical protein